MKAWAVCNGRNIQLTTISPTKRDALQFLSLGDEKILRVEVTIINRPSRKKPRAVRATSEVNAGL